MAVTKRHLAMILNKEELLKLDGSMMDHPSFKAIMKDGKISEVKLKAQMQKVMTLLEDIEHRSSPEQQKELEHFLTEMNVLFTAYNYHALQTVIL